MEWICPRYCRRASEHRRRRGPAIRCTCSRSGGAVWHPGARARGSHDACARPRARWRQWSWTAAPASASLTGVVDCGCSWRLRVWPGASGRVRRSRASTPRWACECILDAVLASPWGGLTNDTMAMATTTKRWTLVRASPVPPQERQTMRSFLLRGAQQSTRLARSRPRNVASLTWCFVPRPRTGA